MEAEMIWRIACAGVGYLFGSFLTAELVARLAAGKAPEQIGTGNPGMANIMANVGKGAGFAVLAGDLAKTFLACGLCVLLAGSRIGTDAATLYGGVGAICGHNFPLWKRGRGGKGVTVTCAWLTLYLWPWGLGCCILGGAAVLLSGYLPIGAVLIPAAAVPAAFLFRGVEGGILVSLAALVMVTRHIRGLRRIREGTEKKSFRRKNSERGENR